MNYRPSSSCALGVTIVTLFSACATEPPCGKFSVPLHGSVVTSNSGVIGVRVNSGGLENQQPVIAVDGNAVLANSWTETLCVSESFAKVIALHPDQFIIKTNENGQVSIDLKDSSGLPKLPKLPTLNEL